MDASPKALSASQRNLILVAAFLGWMLAGVQLGVSSLVSRVAAQDLLGVGDEGDIGRWFGWLISAFLLGAAAGGYGFGWLGDRFGRKRAMAASIACYSVFAGLTYFAASPGQLLVLRFATGLGVGGMWPNGIALVSEAWAQLSRPVVAGVIGTAANIGIMLISILTIFVHVTPDDWRWVMALGATPLVLAAAVAWFVPESPRWMAIRRQVAQGAELAGGKDATERTASPLVEVFRPPVLRFALLGIVLGAIPLFGGWGVSNWATAWASQVGDRQEASPDEKPEGDGAEAGPALKAWASLARSAPGSIASLLGGAVAALIGRRLSYFLFSLACLICAQGLFWLSHPADKDFLYWTAALGAFSGFFFGWLPLCLPELFPTRVRATGAGVSFNFGRIATVAGILISAGLLKEMFAGSYAELGRVVGLVYVLGMIVVWFIPDAERSDLAD